MMKLRLAAPDHLVDLGRVKDLNYIREQAGALHIGATLDALCRGELRAGTVEVPVAGGDRVATSATCRCAIGEPSAAAWRTPIRRRIIRRLCRRWRRRWCCAARSPSAPLSIDDFFVDTFTTSIEPGEMIREVIVPIDGAGVGVCYQKVAQKASGFAMVGIAARVRKRGRKIAMARIGVTGLSNRAYRATARRESAGGTHRNAGGDPGRRGAGAQGRRSQFRPPRFGGVSHAPGGGLRGARAGQGSGEGGVKIAGSTVLAVPPERAYEMMQDPEVLARAMPGCEGLESIGPDEYRMKMKMAMASLSGAFEGKVRIADKQPPSSFKLMVEGTGKIGFMKGEGLLKLSPPPGGTAVAYEGDVQVGGTMAAVGQRLIDATAKMMIKKFFEKLAFLNRDRQGAVC